jgi:hypothetical protein
MTHTSGLDTSASAPASARPSTLKPLTDEQRKALQQELNAEFWSRVRGQVKHRPWPSRLQTWDVTPEGRVLAGVQTRQSSVWLDAGPVPVIPPSDARLQRLIADRKACEQVWRQACKPWGSRAR